MAADVVIKAGDTVPYLNETLEYSDQSPVDLNGKTVALTMRSLTSTDPVTLTGTMTVVDESNGIVSYQFSSQDTSVPGNYLANIVVTAGSDTMTFPTDGYLWVEVQPNVTSELRQLVGLPDVKDYLNVTSSDHAIDARLLRLIETVRPVVESITGPIIPQQFDEWHDGGQTYVKLRRCPSTGYGTSPTLTLLAVSEYNGPIEWPLSIVASPDRGQLYSVMLDLALGRVVRRTAGGGEMGFPIGSQAVHVVYESGQSEIPANVYEGTLELLRVNYQQTMSVGRGSRTRADESDTGAPLGFFVPRRVRELLAPNRRFPSIA